MTDELPGHACRLFAHYEDPAQLPAASSHLVLAKILEEGDRADLRWLTDRYSEPELATWVDQHGDRQLSSRSLAFWRIVLTRTGPGTRRAGEALWPL